MKLFADITQSVEYLLGKEEVIGSNPIISSSVFMFLCLVVFEIANLMDMYLTITYIFKANDFVEVNPLIARAGVNGLVYTKTIAGIAGIFLYYGGLYRYKVKEAWKFNKALFWSALIYSALMVWWAYVLISI